MNALGYLHVNIVAYTHCDTQHTTNSKSRDLVHRASRHIWKTSAVFLVHTSHGAVCDSPNPCLDSLQEPHNSLPAFCWVCTANHFLQREREKESVRFDANCGEFSIAQSIGAYVNGKMDTLHFIRTKDTLRGVT